MSLNSTGVKPADEVVFSQKNNVYYPRIISNNVFLRIYNLTIIED